MLRTVDPFLRARPLACGFRRSLKPGSGCYFLVIKPNTTARIPEFMVCRVLVLMWPAAAYKQPRSGPETRKAEPIGWPGSTWRMPHKSDKHSCTQTLSPCGHRYIHIRTRMYMFVHVCICMYADMQANLKNRHIFTCIHACMHACIHTYIHVCIYTCMHK